MLPSGVTVRDPDEPTEPTPLSMLTVVAFITDHDNVTELPIVMLGLSTEKLLMIVAGPGCGVGGGWLALGGALTASGCPSPPLA